MFVVWLLSTLFVVFRFRSFFFSSNFGCSCCCLLFLLVSFICFGYSQCLHFKSYPDPSVKQWPVWNAFGFICIFKPIDRSNFFLIIISQSKKFAPTFDLVIARLIILFILLNQNQKYIINSLSLRELECRIWIYWVSLCGAIIEWTIQMHGQTRSLSQSSIIASIQEFSLYPKSIVGF